MKFQNSISKLKIKTQIQKSKRKMKLRAGVCVRKYKHLLIGAFLFVFVPKRTRYSKYNLN